jgi:hypothetical protein
MSFVICQISFSYAARHDYYHVGFEVLTAVVMNDAIFGDKTLHGPYVGRPSHLLLSGVLLGRFSAPKTEVIVPTERRFTYGLHGGISKKMATLIIIRY